LHASKKYNVSSADNFLISMDQHVIDENTYLIWHKELPLKVCLFMRWLLRNHIPKNDNLIRRDVMSANALLCVGRCGNPKDVDHLFLQNVF